MSGIGGELSKCESAYTFMAVQFEAERYVYNIAVVPINKSNMNVKTTITLLDAV